MTAFNAYPFAAIVGQPLLKQALLLCAVDPGIGGVLVRGDKGTAKSTAARGLTQVLPPIILSEGCAFHCAPGHPASACTVCNTDPVQRQDTVPFVTLPLGATEDRVLGSLDLQQALQGGQRAFQPGLLAAAHRGILYIDEVNLLADHLVDVLLDVAAMGVNSVQREGISVSHPARFTLIGTMNLEEGDLRPQLLDRFGLMVEVSAPTDKTVRAEVVRRRIAFETDPAAFAQRWQPQQDALLAQLAEAQRLLPDVVLDDAMLELISHLCCEFEVASLRADIVMHKTARAIAALQARTRVTPDDVREAALLVLPHRRRRKPFEQTGMDEDKLDDLVDQARQPEPPQPQTEHGDTRGEDAAETPPSDEPQQEQEQEGEGGQQTFAVAAAGTVRRISVAATPQAAANAASGRRSAVADANRGNAVRAVPDANPDRLAIGATLRSAAVRGALAGETDGPLTVTRDDLHRQVRSGRGANLIVFVVDASGSMAAQRRMEAVKGAVLALLTDAYQRRDQLAVIAFRGEQAQLLLAPTRSADLAEQGLRELPTGGRTPLPHALQLAAQVLQQAAQQSAQEAPPLLVILSDGKANVSLPGSSGDPWTETLQAAQTLAAQGVPALVLDTEAGYLRLGRAAQLAEALGAPCLTLEQLTGDALALTVRAQLGAR
ncbi:MULTISPECIES: putative cobaltochelatase [unclassified Herbaspirillum]|uniref:putative cobaltochelatase n=1 Tax=unclassified Herbaspirillum TaxID=2624150 RepID=UPI000C0984EC|nr:MULTISPECIES: putative cobaltochelatase [unclassified Herbaspirillum]MAF01328.1 magnesium chelatase [Herbaspirillum sp.]MBO16320.1 magnesium chelatase [Herbaspirillum sp.]